MCSRVPYPEMGGAFRFYREKEAWPVCGLSRLRGRLSGLQIPESRGARLLAEGDWAAPYSEAVSRDERAPPPGLEGPSGESVALAVLGKMWSSE